MSSPTYNILLIVEGEKTEVDLFEKMSGLFLTNDKKIKFFSFKTNIYKLYLTLKDDVFVDLVGALKEKAPDNCDKSIFEEKFSEIYLIFDADFQDNNFKEHKIRKMTEFFTDQFDNGKLYINYPMVESYRHHDKFNLDKYLLNKIELNGLSSKSYKDFVDTVGSKKSLNSYNQSTFEKLIYLNLAKAEFLVKGNKRLPTYQELNNELNQLNILNKQLDLKNKDNVISILNTSLFILIDMLGEKFFQKIKKVKLK